MKKHGASIVIMGEEQIARAMIEDVRKAVLAPGNPVKAGGSATASVLTE